jgi:hypothetical protein
MVDKKSPEFLDYLDNNSLGSSRSLFFNRYASAGVKEILPAGLGIVWETKSCLQPRLYPKEKKMVWYTKVFSLRKK